CLNVEQHGRPPETLLLPGSNIGGTDFLHTTQPHRHTEKLRINAVCENHRQRGLANTGRAPQDHRTHMTCFDGFAQRLALTKQMALTHVLLQRGRTHACRQRLPLVFPIKQIRHSDYCSSMTSTESSSLSSNTVSASFSFLVMRVNSIRVVWPRLSSRYMSRR